MKEYIERFLERHFQTDWKSCTDEQLYQALLSMTQEKTQQLPKRDEKGRKLYYLSAEFLVGMVLNVWMRLDIWNYSDMPYNLLGQISLLFSCGWFLLSLPAIVLDDWLRHWWFGEDRPKYKIL